MTNPERRRFIQVAATIVGGVPLAGCGGGGAGEEATGMARPLGLVDPAPAVGPSAQPGAAGASIVLPPSSGAMRFTLSSGATVAAAPFSLGYAFRRGDIPAGSTVASDFGSLQVTPRNLWPDGSLKTAHLAGKAALQAGVPAVVTLRKVPQPPPFGVPALTVADLRRTGITAAVNCGSLGSASWALADWDGFFLWWVAGPQMSSWIYRKPVGSDPHLVAWLEVRLFAGGAVEVLPWVENGYLDVPNPTSKSASYSFVLGGTQRYGGSIDLKHHQRTPLIGDAALSYWLAGAAPLVSVQHDALYMMETELVPPYHRGGPGLADRVSALPASYAPLQAGGFTYSSDSMPSPGYQEPIGLLPQHDVLYLAADHIDAYAGVVRSGFSAGRYGTHYRDSLTQRPIDPARYPHLCIRSGQGFYASGGSTTGSYTPLASGGHPPTWDMAHCPSVGYLAYLVTGSFYFLEEAQFAAMFNHLGVSDLAVQRDGARGLVQADPGSVGVRDSAWAWRTLTQALCITPDTDSAMKNALKVVVQNNIDHFHGRYVAQPNDPLGYTQAGTAAYDGTLSTVAPWQQDFLTAAWGWSVSMGLPISSAHQARLLAFFSWTAQSVVHRLGTPASGWSYQNAATYTARISSPARFPDWNGGTGPWYSAAEAYAATYTPAPAWLGDVSANTLAGEDLPASPRDAVRSFWGNLQPAISYAVRHGVPGALAGYQRMVGASNWPGLRAAFDTNPVWAVKPLRGVPAWLAGKPANTWFAIPGTSGAGGAAVDAFSGFAFRADTSEIYIAAAGGHTNSYDNRVVSLGLGSDSPRWVLRSAASSVPAWDVAYYADGKPSSRHLYQTTHWVPALGRVMLMGARFTYGSGVEFKSVDGFDPVTNRWDPRGTWADLPARAGYGAVVDGSGQVWTTGLSRWNAATRTWTAPITTQAANGVRWPYAYDSARDQLFGLCYADGEGYGPASVNAIKVPVNGNASIQVSFNPSAALAQFTADAPQYAGMDYDPINDRFLFYCGMGTGAGRVYVVKPNAGTVWDISILGLGAGSATPPDPGVGGVNNRFRYVPALGGFVLLANGGSELYFLKTT